MAFQLYSPTASALPRFSFRSNFPSNPSNLESAKISVRCSLDDDNYSSSSYSSEKSGKVELNKSIPRLWCLTCLCSTVAFMNVTGSSISERKAVALDGMERAVCRNCGG